MMEEREQYEIVRSFGDKTKLSVFCKDSVSFPHQRSLLSAIAAFVSVVVNVLLIVKIIQGEGTRVIYDDE
jgi:hypothetical protein